MKIYKYKNKKLYDTKTSRYIKLSDVPNLLKTREQVVFVNYETKADITDVVLSSVLRKLNLSRDKMLELIKGATNV